VRMAGFQHMGGVLRPQNTAAWLCFVMRGGENGLVVVGYAQGPPWSLPGMPAMRGCEEEGGGQREVTSGRV